MLCVRTFLSFPCMSNHFLIESVNQDGTNYLTMQTSRAEARFLKEGWIVRLLWFHVLINSQYRRLSS